MQAKRNNDFLVYNCILPKNTLI